jgi:hypothetical protein
MLYALFGSPIHATYTVNVRMQWAESETVIPVFDPRSIYKAISDTKKHGANITLVCFRVQSPGGPRVLGNE